MEEEKNYTPREEEPTRASSPREESDHHPHRDEERGTTDEDILSRDGVRAAVEGFEEGEHSLSDNDGGESPAPRRRSSPTPMQDDEEPSPPPLAPPPVDPALSSEFDPKRIFVGRLVKGMSAHKLQDVVERYFSSFGVVERIILPVDAQTGLSKGFSFITFTESAAVKLVLSCPHVIDEVEVDCKPAFPRNSTKSLQDLADVPGTLFKTRKVFVAGLPSFVSDTELAGHFTRYGPVISGRVIRDKRTGHPRGFGFVEFTTEAAVDKTMSNFSSHYIGGRWVMCKRASMNPPKEKGIHVTSMLEPAVRSTLLRALSCSLSLPRRHDACYNGPPPSGLYGGHGSGQRYHHDSPPPMHWQSARRRTPSPEDSGYRRSYSSRSNDHVPCPCCHDRRPTKRPQFSEADYDGGSGYGSHHPHNSQPMSREEEYYRRPRYDSPPVQPMRRRNPPPPPPSSGRGPYDDSPAYSSRRPPRGNSSPNRPPPAHQRSPTSERNVPSNIKKEEIM